MCGQYFRLKWRVKRGASDISHKLSVHFYLRGTLLAGQYLYHVKAHRSNGNNKGSVFPCGQNFRRKLRLKVRASDISHKLLVHFYLRGTLLAGQYLYHVKAHALNSNNKGSVSSCGQNFRRKWRLKVGASDIALM